MASICLPALKTCLGNTFLLKRNVWVIKCTQCLSQQQLDGRCSIQQVCHVKMRCMDIMLTNTITPLPTLHHSCSGSILLVELLAFSGQNPRPLQLQISYCPYSSVIWSLFSARLTCFWRIWWAVRFLPESCLSPCFCFNCCIWDLRARKQIGCG